MFQSINAVSTSSVYENVMFKSKSVDKLKSNSLERQERYSRYVKEFNEIPKKANRFFWGAQFLGTALGAIGGFIGMTKGKILTSAKEATLVGAGVGWFLSFCVGLAKKSDVTKKQNKLTQDYMKSEERYIK